MQVAQIRADMFDNTAQELEEIKRQKELRENSGELRDRSKSVNGLNKGSLEDAMVRTSRIFWQTERELRRENPNRPVSDIYDTP